LGEPDTAWAPAKINLVLEVGARRSDGYHELVTVFQSVALHDRVTILDTVSSGDLVVRGPQAHSMELDDPRTNLAWRAAELLADATGRSSPGVQIHLEKHIPVAAGLGGGSSDAAAVLRSLAKRWDISDQRLLLRLAGELGSDVPFFLRGGAALGRGRGELLSPLSLPQMWVVLANPGVPSSTASVYNRFARRAKPSADVLGRRCEQTVQVLCSEGPAAMGGHLWHNDLAEAALDEVPDIRSILNAFRDLGALGTQISGSGATVFAVATDAAHAESMSDQVSKQTAWTWWGPTTTSEGEATNGRCSKANKAR
jgi:4-diphosphocytidyl-2-C-methyl-D-erythritol kinase